MSNVKAPIISVAEQDKSEPSSTIIDNSPSVQVNSSTIDTSEFSAEEIELAKSLVPQIDILDYGLVSSYGNEAQRSLSESSDRILRQIRSKVTSSVGGDFEELLNTISIINADNPSLKSKIGFIARKGIQDLIISYYNVEKEIAIISRRLKEHQLVIMQDMDVLNKLKVANQRLYKTLSLYIIAGQIKLEQIEKDILPPLKEVSALSTENAEKYRRTFEAFEHFKKKIYDLMVSRNVSLQVSTEIGMLLLNDATILERINTILSSTIPLWKSQVAISLGLSDAQDALAFSSKLTEGASKTLQDNAKRIKELSKEVAKQSKRKDVDIATFEKSNSDLLDAINSARKIQQDSLRKRQSAETSLRAVELELKNELKKTGGA